MLVDSGVQPNNQAQNQGMQNNQQLKDFQQNSRGDQGPINVQTTFSKNQFDLNREIFDEPSMIHDIKITSPNLQDNQNQKITTKSNDSNASQYVETFNSTDPNNITKLNDEISNLKVQQLESYGTQQFPEVEKAYQDTRKKLQDFQQKLEDFLRKNQTSNVFAQVQFSTNVQSIQSLITLCQYLVKTIDLQLAVSQRNDSAKFKMAANQGIKPPPILLDRQPQQTLQINPPQNNQQRNLDQQRNMEWFQAQGQPQAQGDQTGDNKGTNGKIDRSTLDPFSNILIQLQELMYSERQKVELFDVEVDTPIDPWLWKPIDKRSNKANKNNVKVLDKLDVLPDSSIQMWLRRNKDLVDQYKQYPGIIRLDTLGAVKDMLIQGQVSNRFLFYINGIIQENIRQKILSQSQSDPLDTEVPPNLLEMITQQRQQEQVAPPPRGGPLLVANNNQDLMDIDHQQQFDLEGEFGNLNPNNQQIQAQNNQQQGPISVGTGGIRKGILEVKQSNDGAEEGNKRDSQRLQEEKQAQQTQLRKMTYFISKKVSQLFTLYDNLKDSLVAWNQDPNQPKSNNVAVYQDQGLNQISNERQVQDNQASQQDLQDQQPMQINPSDLQKTLHLVQQLQQQKQAEQVPSIQQLQNLQQLIKEPTFNQKDDRQQGRAAAPPFPPPITQQAPNLSNQKNATHQGISNDIQRLQQIIQSNPSDPRLAQSLQHLLNQVQDQIKAQAFKSDLPPPLPNPKFNFSLLNQQQQQGQFQIPNQDNFSNQQQNFQQRQFQAQQEQPQTITGNAILISPQGQQWLEQQLKPKDPRLQNQNNHNQTAQQQTQQSNQQQQQQQAATLLIQKLQQVIQQDPSKLDQIKNSKAMLDSLNQVLNLGGKKQPYQVQIRNGELIFIPQQLNQNVNQQVSSNDQVKPNQQLSQMLMLNKQSQNNPNTYHSPQPLDAQNLAQNLNQPQIAIQNANLSPNQIQTLAQSLQNIFGQTGIQPNKMLQQQLSGAQPPQGPHSQPLNSGPPPNIPPLPPKPPPGINLNFRQNSSQPQNILSDPLPMQIPSQPGKLTPVNLQLPSGQQGQNQIANLLLPGNQGKGPDIQQGLTQGSFIQPPPFPPPLPPHSAPPGLPNPPLHNQNQQQYLVVNQQGQIQVQPAIPPPPRYVLQEKQQHNLILNNLLQQAQNQPPPINQNQLSPKHGLLQPVNIGSSQGNWMPQPPLPQEKSTKGQGDKDQGDTQRHTQDDQDYVDELTQVAQQQNSSLSYNENFSKDMWTVEVVNEIQEANNTMFKWKQRRLKGESSRYIEEDEKTQSSKDRPLYETMMIIMDNEITISCEDENIDKQVQKYACMALFLRSLNLNIGNDLINLVKKASFYDGSQNYLRENLDLDQWLQEKYNRQHGWKAAWRLQLQEAVEGKDKRVGKREKSGADDQLYSDNDTNSPSMGRQKGGKGRKKNRKLGHDPDDMKNVFKNQFGMNQQMWGPFGGEQKVSKTQQKDQSDLMYDSLSEDDIFQNTAGPSGKNQNQNQQDTDYEELQMEDIEQTEKISTQQQSAQSTQQQNTQQGAKKDSKVMGPFSISGYTSSVQTQPQSVKNVQQKSEKSDPSIVNISDDEEEGQIIEEGEI